MKRLVGLLLAAVLVAGSTPPAEAGTPLTKRETARMVDHLLRVYIAPAVTNSTKAVDTAKVRVWDCRVTSDRKGSCKGKVVVGLVTCEGRFRVAKSRRDRFASWPVEMTCTS